VDDVTIVVRPRAVQASREIRKALDQRLVEAIDLIIREAEVLSDPSQFEGRGAASYRAQWPDRQKNLLRTREELASFFAQLNDIVNRIIIADRSMRGG
jgi:hypothetical protein